MPKSLVIVESPAKARTIAGFLGDGFTVDSSVGHIRDLPTSSELPESYKHEPWASYGINVFDGFKPVYVVAAEKKKKVAELKRLMRDADELFLATDEDREGEAIAWHLLEVLNPPPDMPVKRMVFHEITPAAIAEAIANPRQIDRRLVDAQETRRILDRLYGWDVTSVVRRVVSHGASAGRVQSVAVRIVVDRERERMAFVTAGYWSIEAELSRTDGDQRPFTAALVSLDGARVATGRDFDAAGVAKAGTVVLDEVGAATVADELRVAAVAVRSVERKPYRRRPAAPFITSTLQQEAGSKLRYSAQRTMRAAQALYEQGFITYMRTDSTTLSATALTAARNEIVSRYGAENLPSEPRMYAKKVKNAQEAHEAIRPAGEQFRHPDEVERLVNADMASVYRLVWQRTIASQMIDATGETVSVRMGAALSSGRDAELGTSGTVITHPGFRLAYVEESAEADTDDDQQRQLPAMAEGDVLGVGEVTAEGHSTQPPARFTEATLIKRLEELGVGRPSTYASIMNTILDRGYVWKKGTALVPTWTAFAVVKLMEERFTSLVDYAFTARMEEDLDAIANGEEEMVPWLSRFYWGSDGPIPPGGPSGGGSGLHALVENLPGLDVRELNAFPIGVDADGQPVEARSGKYGPFVSRGEDTAPVPEDLPPDELTLDKALELLSAPREGRVLGVDPQTGLNVYARAGRFGPYVQLGELVDGAKEKPRTSSLFARMALDTVTFDEALALLSLPREVGVDADDGGVVTALNGRYGPYLQKVLPDGSTDTRSIDDEDLLLTIDLDGVRAAFAQPKRRRGQAAPKPPLRELGNDPVSGRPMVIKEGRWGPYVTDGETNASLRTGDDPASITDERAAELLGDRRARGPATKKKAAKKSSKKAARKKPAKKAAKKVAKKAPAKRAPAKKASPADGGPEVGMADDDGAD
jgi:DNA topoisomerase-1